MDSTDQTAAETPVEAAGIPPEPTETVSPEAISWTASEFIAHEKSFWWYLGLTAFAIVLSVLAFIISKEIISVAVVIFGSILFGIYAARKPRQLEYQLSNTSVGIGDKYHPYDEFRSFAIVPEGAFANITFMPLKRFGVPLSIYYAPEDEERIVKMLSDKLPLADYKHDAIDRLMRRVRF